MKKIEYHMALVEWVDSYGVSSSWTELSDIKPYPHYCYSCGWIVKDNDESIVIVPHISPEHKEINVVEQGCGDMTIPKKAIIKIDTLFIDER